MKILFLIIFLFAIINCVPGDFKDKYKRSMRLIKEIMTQCILDTPHASEILKNALNGNNDPNIKIILHSVINQLDDQDLLIINRCRKQATRVIREKLGEYSK